MITCCHAGDSPYIYDDEDIVAPKHLQAGSVLCFFPCRCDHASLCKLCTARRGYRLDAW